MSLVVDVMKSIFHSEKFYCQNYYKNTGKVKKPKNQKQLIICHQLKTREEGNKTEKTEENQEYTQPFRNVKNMFYFQS